MKIKIIVGVVLCIYGGLLAVVIPEMSQKQTAEEIQTQKDFANQASLPNVSEDSKTPLKLFEAYFAAKSRTDASEFNYFTKRGVTGFFDDPEELTAEDRKNISDGAKESGIKGHKVVGFWYHADAEKPSITFAYMYSQNGETSVPITRYQEVKLDLIKTEKGWRIDQLTELRGW